MKKIICERSNAKKDKENALLLALVVVVVVAPIELSDCEMLRRRRRRPQLGIDSILFLLIFDLRWSPAPPKGASVAQLGICSVWGLCRSIDHGRGQSTLPSGAIPLGVIRSFRVSVNDPTPLRARGLRVSVANSRQSHGSNTVVRLRCGTRLVFVTTSIRGLVRAAVRRSTFEKGVKSEKDFDRQRRILSRD